MPARIIVHGGAWDIPNEAVLNHKEGCTNAAKVGLEILINGGTALDAVEQTVRTMELDPTFDAGKGAFLNLKGEIELDAIICDGKTLKFGAVAALQNIMHPISLARKIMVKTEHHLLVGNGANEFAKQEGFEFLSTDKLLVGRELERWKRLKDDPDFKTKQVFDKFPHGTVGAVAFDRNGNLAAGTSTGGTPKKLPGRVGDTPIIGSGAYADNLFGAVSSTGWGETLMRVSLALRVIFYLEEGFEILRASNRAVEYLKNRVNGLGGVIGIDNNGNIGWAYNTPRMAYAIAKEEDQRIIVGI